MIFPWMQTQERVRQPHPPTSRAHSPYAGASLTDSVVVSLLEYAAHLSHCGDVYTDDLSLDADNGKGASAPPQ